MSVEPAYAFLIALAVSVTFALAVEAIRSRLRARRDHANTAVTACSCSFRVSTTSPRSLKTMRQIMTTHHQSTGATHGTPIEHIPKRWQQ